MSELDIFFHDLDLRFPLISVTGTGPEGYEFGEKEKSAVRLNNFLISKYPVTQALWKSVVKENPSRFTGEKRPVENVSFVDITKRGGFLDLLNKGNANPKITGFRLPSETEWEYAARGGYYWRDGFLFSGSNEIDSVGWYDGNSGTFRDPETISKLKNHEKGTSTKDVGEKLPNRLGLCDMSGNVWEWCEDYFQRDLNKIPTNGAPCLEKSDERVLRGGCHHNWSIHCTVSKRYAIMPDAKDECIGFRIAASMA